MERGKGKGHGISSGVVSQKKKKISRLWGSPVELFGELRRRE